MAIADKASDANHQFHDIVCEIEISNRAESCGIRPGPTVDAWDRFKLWVGNIGANHQPASSLSLESRLAGAAELLQEVLDLLEDLTDALTELYEILIGHQANRSIIPVQTLAENINEGNEDESDTETTTPVADMHNEAQGLLGAVNECIRSLFRVSILIARATPRDRFALAQSNRRNHFLDDFDISYVEERYPKLAGPGSAWLRKRLGRANTKRRQFLRYCHQHRDALAGLSRQNDDVKGLLPLAILNDEKPLKAEEQLTLAAPAVAKPIAKFFDMVSDAALTKPSTKASTLNIEMLKEDGDIVEEDDTKSYTSAASSANLDAEKYLELPRLVDVNDGRDTFECPFCCTIKKFTKERSWKKHAFEDLRAYVCTVGGTECDNELFGDRKTWFNHESQRHRSQWTCIICQVGYFRTPSHLKDHAISHHSDLGPEVVESLVSAGQRPLQLIPASDCPFCDEWEKTLRSNLEHTNIQTSTTTNDVIVVEVKQFRQHVASHLQQLALFSIPRGIMDDESDVCSSDAARQSVSSQSHPERKTPADIMEVSWDDPNPPLQQAIARGNMSEMFRLLDEGADPNTVGETWGTAIDAALAAPWSDNSMGLAVTYLRDEGGLRASELLEEIDNDDAPQMHFVEETHIEEIHGRRTPDEPEPPSLGLDYNTPNPWDRGGAMAPRPQEPRSTLETVASGSWDRGGAMAPGPQETRSPLETGASGPWQPHIERQLQIREDIAGLQSALASFGHEYDAFNTLHSRILTFFAREHPLVPLNYLEESNIALREILDDLERWKMLFQCGPGAADDTNSRGKFRRKISQMFRKDSGKGDNSPNDMDIERFRRVLAVEFPKLVLPGRLIFHLYQPLKDQLPITELDRGLDFKTEGMTWDDFVYSMLLVRAVTTVFPRDTTSNRRGEEIFDFETFLVAMLEITALQGAINPPPRRVTAPMNTDTWASASDGRPVLWESLWQAFNSTI